MISLFRATLKLVAHQQLVVFHPPRDNPQENNQAESPFIYGDVILSLPSARAVERLVVRHVVKYTLMLPGQRPEAGILQTSEVEIALPPTLNAGKNVFPWALQIPRDAWPSERASAGSVSHYLQTIATGAGLMGGALEDELEVEVIHGHGAASVVYLHMEGISDLGPYSIDFDSPHLTTGGLLRLHVRFPPTPTERRLRCIIVQIEETITTRPPIYADSEPHTSSRLVPFAVVDRSMPRRPHSSADQTPGVLYTETALPHDAELLAVVPPACEVGFEHAARLPDHRALPRPTSDRMSASFIRVAHRIVVQIRYWREGYPKERIVTFQGPIELTSCRCQIETVLLPLYDRGSPGSKEASAGCACTLSVDELWSMHKAMILLVSMGFVYESPGEFPYNREAVPGKLRRFSSSTVHLIDNEASRLPATMRGAITLPNGEWDALEILGKLSASPCPIPHYWIDNVHYLDYSAWMEDTYVTFPTMLRLCTHLPMLRILVAHYPSLPAPVDDLGELVSAIRTSGAFRNVERFELNLGGDRGAITAAFALLESMRKLRRLKWNVGDYSIDWKRREFFFSQHDAEHALVIDQLDLSHLRLRWYQCLNLCVGCELPLVHSGETLEYLGISLDPISRPDVVRDLTSVLRSMSFVRLRTLKLSIFEGTSELALSSVLRDEMLSTLSSYSCLRRLTLRCILPALEATLGLLTAPLCELRIAAAMDGRRHWPPHHTRCPEDLARTAFLAPLNDRC